MKITIEAPRKNNQIVQCTRCQTYGHTKSYCSRPYVCVKCGGDHNTTLCTKTHSTPATCALCGGDHPASYKGCIVYKTLQQARGKPRNPIHPTTIQTHPTPVDIADAHQFPPLSHPLRLSQLPSFLLPHTPELFHTTNSLLIQPIS